MVVVREIRNFETEKDIKAQLPLTIVVQMLH